ncbi:hypothetical protein SAMN04488117_103344 [Celeribacter baekdonensis]|uniref:Uncharacterized protein n=1 Tax=Celeribacter baekdonensis TaxID=875171 RepID=A0A1G7K674_9RHOB|nr:hypothetical protein [Celeribacter baekdonensis]SDF32733.1 hypothetical protein SAMN04488117_103344 [Celeribacter baekdonensis]
MNTLKTMLATSALLTTLATGTFADEVTDTLESALKAYGEGDVSYAIEELDYAKQLLKEMQTGALSDFFPAPPAGWTAEDDADTVAGFAMMGGGTAAAKRYFNDAGEEFTMTIVVDSPMIGMMGGMLQNAGAMGLKTIRVGREKFVDQDGTVSALIEGRVLVQVEGGEQDVIVPLLEQINFRDLGRFGY